MATTDNPSTGTDARWAADIVHGRLVELDATVGVAESLTGGLISTLLTEAPGTSTTFRGGLVVYSTDLKHRLAGVDDDLLDERGPVDPQVAEQLAAGVRERIGATYGLSVTGVAGPGEQNGHPVGQVFVGVASPTGCRSVEHRFEGSRADIRTAAAAAALSTLVEVLDADIERARDDE